MSIETPKTPKTASFIVDAAVFKLTGWLGQVSQRWWEYKVWEAQLQIRLVISSLRIPHFAKTD